MQVTINKRPAAELSDDQQKDLRLSAGWAAVEGFVLDSTEAANRALIRLRLVCLCFVVFVGLVFLVVLPVMWGIAGTLLIALVFWLVYSIKRQRLLSSLPERSRASPPAGTKIRVDNTGLAIGNRSAAWKDVSVEGVDFLFMSTPRGYRAYFVTCLHLRLGDVPCVLDKSLLEEGVAIVDCIYRHKFRVVGA